MAEIVGEKRIPFLAVRVISDEYQHVLPLGAIAAGFDAELVRAGRRPSSCLGYLITHPGREFALQEIRAGPRPRAEEPHEVFRAAKHRTTRTLVEIGLMKTYRYYKSYASPRIRRRLDLSFADSDVDKYVSRPPLHLRFWIACKFYWVRRHVGRNWLRDSATPTRLSIICDGDVFTPSRLHGVVIAAPTLRGKIQSHEIDRKGPRCRCRTKLREKLRSSTTEEREKPFPFSRTTGIMDL